MGDGSRCWLMIERWGGGVEFVTAILRLGRSSFFFVSFQKVGSPEKKTPMESPIESAPIQKKLFPVLFHLAWGFLSLRDMVAVHVTCRSWTRDVCLEKRSVQHTQTREMSVEGPLDEGSLVISTGFLRSGLKRHVSSLCFYNVYNMPSAAMCDVLSKNRALHSITLEECNKLAPIHARAMMDAIARNLNIRQLKLMK